MARRRKQDESVIAIIAMAISAFYVIIKWIFCLIHKFATRGAVKKTLVEEQERAQRVREQVVVITKQHAATLARKKKQLLIADEYGVVDSSLWTKEMHRFHVNVVQPQVLNPNGAQSSDEAIAMVIEEILKECPTANLPPKIGFSEAMNPYEYEHFCAAILSGDGWNARATKAGGDQGSDVIAEKDGLKIVLQCKLYTQPVGNRAVQEVFAAKTHEQADYAAVITNHTFTRSARQIAATTQIELLHHEQLRDWARNLFFLSSSAKLLRKHE